MFIVIIFMTIIWYTLGDLVVLNPVLDSDSRIYNSALCIYYPILSICVFLCVAPPQAGIKISFAEIVSREQSAMLKTTRWLMCKKVSNKYNLNFHSLDVVSRYRVP